MDNPSIPGIISKPRLTTLGAALLVALGSGTNYVFSAYAPQLASRLKISHTQLNLVALGGNAGVYLTGPLWGRIADRRGPQPLFVCAFLLLFTGYIGLRYFYDSGVPPGEILASWRLYAMILLGFFTGSGGNAGFASAVNATAKSFPASTRATATGIVLSGFGLSAFFFSMIAHILFHSDTSGFLLTLAVGTALPMVLGFFLVRPIPLTAIDVAASAHCANNSLGPLDAGSQTPLLHSQDDEETMGSNREFELSPSRSRSRGLGYRLASRQRSDEVSKRSSCHDPNVHGLALWMNLDFLTIFIILLALSGQGLMYINNVGSISQVLYAHNNSAYDEATAAQIQATQVSTISIMNFSGRILIGLLSDFISNRLQLRRSYCLTLVSTLFLLSQLTLLSLNSVGDLWKASMLLGLAYGSTFGLFPAIIIDWFGISHFSENWGFVSLAPMIGGNIFSLAFGRNLDAHEPSSTLPQRATVPSASSCELGRGCYIDSVYLTVGTSLLAILLSLWAGWRDKQRIGMIGKEDIAEANDVEVAWQDPEEE